MVEYVFDKALSSQKKSEITKQIKKIRRSLSVVLLLGLNLRTTFMNFSFITEEGLKGKLFSQHEIEKITLNSNYFFSSGASDMSLRTDDLSTLIRVLVST